MPGTTQPPQRSLGKALLLGFGLSWLLALAMVIITLIGGLIAGWSWLQPRLAAFTTAADTSVSEAIVTGVVGWWQTIPKQSNDRTIILVMGLDQLATRGDAPVLTDTMMLVSVNHITGEINTVSIPRDTWSEFYQTRLNSLYFYGQERDAARPEQFASQAISELIDLPIHYTVVITLDQLAHLIDIAGGVNVTVAEGFSDPLFPRTDVDVTVERDPAKLYETVEFTAGPQVMSGERALKYIRSRKSLGDTGGDGARSLRQQQVIQALLERFSQDETWKNPTLLGELYAYYQETFDNFIPLTDTIAISKALFPHRNNISFVGQTISIYPDSATGSLVHPDPRQYNGQWVYVIRDLSLFRNELKAKLHVP